MAVLEGAMSAILKKNRIIVSSVALFVSDLKNAMTSILQKDKDKDVPDIELENLDDLLSQLTADELEELNGDFDPDVSNLPFWC